MLHIEANNRADDQRFILRSYEDAWFYTTYHERMLNGTARCGSGAAPHISMHA